MISSNLGGRLGLNRIESDQRLRGFGENSVKDHRARGPVEGRTSRRHFIKHGPEAEQVSARVQLFAPRLLRRQGATYGRGRPRKPCRPFGMTGWLESQAQAPHIVGAHLPREVQKF